MMPRQMATATTKTKNRHTLATTAETVDMRAPIREEPERASARSAKRCRMRRRALLPSRATMRATMMTRITPRGERPGR